MPNKIVNPTSANLDPLDEEIQELEGDLPEKYKGKTAAENAKMHMEAEKALSRQGQILGEQRKIIDQFVQIQLADKTTTNKTEEAAKPLTTDQLFDDPEKAVKQAVEQQVGARVAQIEHQLIENTRKTEQDKFESKHEGKVTEIISDPAFVDWVKASPYRLRLAQALHNYDFSAGDDLLTLWKELQEVDSEKKKRSEAATKRTQNLRNAQTEGGGVGGEVSPKTIYSRVEISALMTRAHAGDKEAKSKVDNPQWQAAIRKAYEEGRVR